MQAASDSSRGRNPRGRGGDRGTGRGRARGRARGRGRGRGRGGIDPPPNTTPNQPPPHPPPRRHPNKPMPTPPVPKPVLVVENENKKKEKEDESWKRHDGRKIIIPKRIGDWNREGRKVVAAPPSTQIVSEVKRTRARRDRSLEDLRRIVAENDDKRASERSEIVESDNLLLDRSRARDGYLLKLKLDSEKRQALQEQQARVWSRNVSIKAELRAVRDVEPFDIRPQNTSAVRELSAKHVSERSIRVFISSTFLDMNAERDHLATKTFPILRSLCESSNVAVAPVDLRWGITSEQSEHGMVLKHVLTEIDMSRPFFISIIGDRYGWSQPMKNGNVKVVHEDALLTKTFDVAIASGYAWLDKLRDRSITEIECLYGALFYPQLAYKHCHFYFKEADSDSRSHGQTIDIDKRLVLLKERIIKSGLKVSYYSTPAELGEMVKRDVMESIEFTFPSVSGQRPIDLLRSGREGFAADRRMVYIPDESHFHLLSSHLYRSGTTPFVMFGERGSGRSSLIANWIERIEIEQPSTRVVVHYINGSPTAGTGQSIPSDIIATLMHEMKEQAPLTFGALEIPKYPTEIIESFSLWLHCASKSAEPFLIILDAIDEIDAKKGLVFVSGKRKGLDLSWLPNAFPPSVRVVLTASNNIRNDVLKKYPTIPDVEVLTVDPIDIHRRSRLITEYFHHFGKSMSAQQMEKLVSKGASSNPGYLKGFLAELRVSADFEHLDAIIDQYLTANNTKELYELMFDRFKNTFECSSDIGDGIGDSGLLPPGTIQAVLTSLWASRDGISESELLAMFNLFKYRAAWTPFFHSLRQICYTVHGLMNLASEDVADAVADHFHLASDSIRAIVRNRLALYFASLKPTNSRVIAELPVLYCLLGDAKRDALRAYLSDIDVFMELFESDPLQLSAYWRTITGDSYDGMLDEYADSMERFTNEMVLDATTTGVSVSVTQSNRNLNVHDGFMCDGCGMNPIIGTRVHCLDRQCEDHDLCIECHQSGIETLDHMLSHSVQMIDNASTDQDKDQGEGGGEVMPRTPEYAIKVITCLSSFFKSVGKMTEALDMALSALELSEDVYGENSVEVAKSLADVAERMQEIGNYEEGLQMATRSLSIVESGATLCILGLLHKKMGHYDESEALYIRGIDLLESNYGKNVPLVVHEYSMLGDVLRKKAEWVGAKKLYTSVLSFYKLHYGHTHPLCAATLNSIGLVEKKIAQYDRAADHFQEAIDIISESYGKRHPLYAEYLEGLADCHRKKANFKEAKRLYSEVLTLQKEILGDKVSVYETLNNLAMIEKKLGHYQPALTLEDSALEGIGKLLGDTHPKYGDYLGNKGDIHRKLCEYDQALECYQQAMDINTTAQLQDEVGWNLNCIGLVYLAMKRLDDAEDALEQSKTKIGRYFGKNHYKYAQVLNNLGILYKIKGQLPLAMEMYEEAREINQRELGMQHPEVAENLHNIAIVLRLQGNIELSERRQRQALEMVRSTYSDDAAMKINLYSARYEKAKRG